MGLPLPPRRLPTIARSAPAAALLSTDAAVAFTTVLKEAVRIAKALPEGQVQDAAEDLQLSLLRVPGARASLDLLPGLRLPGQLVNFLRSAGEVLISDAACASSALADWCAERRSSPAVESLDVAKPALVNEARDMMGRAPPETDWGLLGSALAVALPALPLGVRVGLMEGTSRDTLWAFVVQAVVRADSGAALDTIRTVLSAALSPGASEPAWVADALPGPVHPPPPHSPCPVAPRPVLLAYPCTGPSLASLPGAPAQPAPRPPVAPVQGPPAAPGSIPDAAQVWLRFSGFKGWPVDHVLAALVPVVGPLPSFPTASPSSGFWYGPVPSAVWTAVSGGSDVVAVSTSMGPIVMSTRRADGGPVAPGRTPGTVQPGAPLRPALSRTPPPRRFSPVSAPRRPPPPP